MKRIKRLALWVVLLCSVAYLGGCPNPAAPPASPAELPSLVAVPDGAVRTSAVAAAAQVSAFGDLQSLALDSFFPVESQQSLALAGGGVLKEATFPSCMQDSDCKSLGFYRNEPLCQSGQCLIKCSEDAQCDFLGDGASCAGEGVCRAPEGSSDCTTAPLAGLAASCQSGTVKIPYCANQLLSVDKVIAGHTLSCPERKIHAVVQFIDCKNTALDGSTIVTLNGNVTAAQVDGPTCKSKAEVEATFPSSCTKDTDCNDGVEAKCLCQLSDGETVRFESGECSGSSGACTRVIDLVQATKSYDVWAIPGLATASGQTSPNLTFTSAASSTSSVASQGTVTVSYTNSGDLVDDQIKLFNFASEINAVDTDIVGTTTTRTTICKTTSAHKVTVPDCTCSSLDDTCK